MNQDTNNLPQKATVSLLPSQSEWIVLKEQARILQSSGFLPDSINSPEKAIAIAVKGREIGMPMMQAFAQINIIKGKPTLSAEGMLSQIYKNCPGALVKKLESTKKLARLEAKRPDEDSFEEFSFSLDDAKDQNLLGKSNWRSMPEIMLYWRVVSKMARLKFPDALNGLSHTAEELGAEIVVTDSGDIEVVEEKVVPNVSSNSTPVSSNWDKVNARSLQEPLTPISKGFTPPSNGSGSTPRGVENILSKKQKSWLLGEAEARNITEEDLDDVTRLLALANSYSEIPSKGPGFMKLLTFVKGCQGKEAFNVRYSEIQSNNMPQVASAEFNLNEPSPPVDELPF